VCGCKCSVNAQQTSGADSRSQARVNTEGGHQAEHPVLDKTCSKIILETIRIETINARHTPEVMHSGTHALTL